MHTDFSKRIIIMISTSVTDYQVNDFQLSYEKLLNINLKNS